MADVAQQTIDDRSFLPERPGRLAASAFACRICGHSVECIDTCGKVDDCDYALRDVKHFHCVECRRCTWGGCQGVRKHDPRAAS